MRTRAISIRPGSAERMYGSIVAADTRDGSGHIVLRKGTRLGEAHAQAIATLVGVEIHLVDLAADELEQDEVARRLAGALAGAGTRADAPEQGQTRLRATGRGVLRVGGETVRAVNALPPLLCFTLPDGQVIVEGDEVAGVKSASLATPAAALAGLERLVRTHGPAVTVSAFVPRRVFVLVTERLEPKARSLVRHAIGKKVAWYGSTVTDVVEVAHERTAALAALRVGLADGAELVLVSGANPLDALDPALAALGDAGGELLRAGVPAHPGSMVWAGRLGAVPILGVATCAGFGNSTALDLVLARVLAGDDLVGAVGEVGHGGLLEGPGAASRLPPYDR